jgi:hypothetical protein
MSALKRLLPWLRFKPYAVSDDGYDPAYYVSTLAQLRTFYREKEWTDPFQEYERFIHGIRDLPNADIVPLKELMTAPVEGRKVLALRFDIDGDPETGVRLARFNARYGICGSFYLLHTAYYHGILKEGRWCRNSSMLREWVKSYIVAGAEVGLHIDPLWLYSTFGIDGADAVREEVQFLRNCGARVEGTVAHNSFPVYGAENFEIFADRTVWKRRTFSTKFGNAPLGVLDMNQLGLTYEGNYASAVSSGKTNEAQEWMGASMVEAANSESWMLRYLHDNPCYGRAYDVVVWHHGGGKWTVSSKLVDNAMWKWKTTMPHVIGILSDLPTDIRVAIVMHPIGFSKDA